VQLKKIEKRKNIPCKKNSEGKIVPQSESEILCQKISGLSGV
jgi:hypothetical protein